MILNLKQIPFRKVDLTLVDLTLVDLTLVDFAYLLREYPTCDDLGR